MVRGVGGVSYCRWSSDDFQCDLYVYEDVRGGVTIHVARSRYVFTKPLPPPIDPPAENRTGAQLAIWIKATIERHVIVTAMLRQARLEPLGLPNDGESFHGLSYRDAADKVRDLIQMGYKCDPTVADILERDFEDSTT